nr:PQQ-binding-like beta-propeller repeat protein [Halorientalis regularis]
MYCVDARNSGHNPDETGPNAPIGEQWRFRTPGQVDSSPAVVDGTVYVGSWDGNVYAVSASDGSEQWRFQTGGWVGSSPAVVDGTVYVGSWDGNVYAVSAADGTEQWRFQTGAAVYSPPAVVDGTVYVGSNDINVYAVSASDGSEQWRFQTNRAVTSSPAVVDGTVYVGSGDGNVYAVSASDGNEQWSFRTGGRVPSSPAVVDGTVYVGSTNGNVYAVSASDGNEQWRFQTDDGVYSSPAVVDGTVYVGSDDVIMYALSASDGTEQWRFQTGAGVYSSPAMVDGTVYVGSDDANVYAVSASDGNEQWRFQTGAGVYSSPAVVDGTVYVGSRDGNVYALSAVIRPQVSYDSESVTTNTAVTFDALNTTLPNVDPGSATYEWAFGANSDFTTTGQQVTHTFEEAGEYTVRLRVSTADGAMATTETNVSVEAAQSEQSSVSDWPQYQYDTANTGHAPNTTGPTQNIGGQWRFQTGAGVYSSPAVVDGTVYVGSDDTSVYALSASDGSEQWRFQTDGQVASSPAVVDGTVYVGSDDTNVYAVSASDGTEQWHFQTDNLVRSPPAVVDGTVYVGSWDGNVYAVSAADGTEQWRFQTDYRVSSRPAVVDGTVYVGSGDGNVYAVSAADGSEQWRFQTRYGVSSSPAVVDGTVYVGSGDGNVYAVSAADGTEQWRFQTDNQVPPSPAVVDGTVYVGSGDGNVYAVSAADGTEQWRFQTGAAVYSSPAVVDGTVYVGSWDSNVYAVSAADGTEQWRFQTGSRVASSPAVVDGTVYVGSRDGNVYALTEGGHLKSLYGFVVDRNLLIGGGAGLTGMTLAGLGAWRYSRGSAKTTTQITTDHGVDNWPCPGHDSTKTAAVPTAREPRTDPETAHRIQPEGSTVDTSPAIDGDHAFVTTNEGALLGVALESGDIELMTALDAENPTPPVVSDQLVVVGTDQGVQAYRQRDGEERWTRSVEGLTTVVADDAVFVGTDTGVQGHHLAGGSQKWQTDCEGQVTALAVADGAVYIAAGTSITALDAETGTQHWQIETRGHNPSLAIGDRLIITTRSVVAAHDPETGKEQWTKDEGGQPTAVALAHGHIYQTTDSDVRALDIRTGTENWRTSIDATTGPVVVGDTVYVGTESDLVALNAADGSYKFTHGLDGVLSRPIVVGNSVFCRTADGSLTVVTGKLGDEPQLHTRSSDPETDPSAAESTTETTDDVTATSSSDLENAEPDSVATRFARDCDSIESASVVDDTGPVHVYRGTLVDQISEEHTHLYALAPEHSEEESVSDFEKIAREWQGISKNTHVATVYDHGSDPRPWIAFDPGIGRLDEALTNLERPKRIDILVDLAEAVRTGSMYNLAHGGITPTTVFLAEDEQGSLIATLADWGLQRTVEKRIEDPPVTPYTAPEQLTGETAGTATDIYRLGAIIYRVLTDEPPFAYGADLRSAIADRDFERPTNVDSSLPTAVDELVATAMATDPDKRFDSPYELRRELVAIFD